MNTINETLQQSFELQPIIKGSNKEYLITVYKSYESQELLDNLTFCGIEVEIKKALGTRSSIVKKNHALGGSNDEIKTQDNAHFSLFFVPKDTIKIGSGSYLVLISITDTDNKVYKTLGGLTII